MNLGQKSQNCVQCNKRGDVIKAENCQWYDKAHNIIICKKHVSLETYRKNKEYNQNTTNNNNNSDENLEFGLNENNLPSYIESQSVNHEQSNEELNGEINEYYINEELDGI
jgi:hypothetical protein